MASRLLLFSDKCSEGGKKVMLDKNRRGERRERRMERHQCNLHHIIQWHYRIIKNFTAKCSVRSHARWSGICSPDGQYSLVNSYGWHMEASYVYLASCYLSSYQLSKYIFIFMHLYPYLYPYSYITSSTKCSKGDPA